MTESPPNPPPDSPLNDEIQRVLRERDQGEASAERTRMEAVIDPPPDAALPVVEECPMDCEWSREQAATLSSHIAALTAQNEHLTNAYAAQQDLYMRAVARVERLRADRDALRDVSKAKSATISALCDTADGVEARGKIEALEWVCSQAMCASWADLGERIKAEIARLKAQGEGE